MAAVIAEMGRARRRARTWPVPAAAAGRADRGPRSEHRSQIARGVCLENPVNRTVLLFARDMERSMKVKEPDLHTVRVTRGDNTHTLHATPMGWTRERYIHEWCKPSNVPWCMELIQHC